MKVILTLLFLLFLLQGSVVFSYDGKIEYDIMSGINNERTGRVWLNGERYNVTERDNFYGSKDIEIKNYNNTYRGTVDQFGYGTLRDYYGNTIEVKPY